MEQAKKVRAILKENGFSQIAASVRAAGGGVVVTVKDLGIPLQRVELLLSGLEGESIHVRFDYRIWNEAVKTYISTAQDFMARGEITTVFENEYFRTVYRPILRSLVLERQTAANEAAQELEITQAKNAYEVAEAYYTLRNRLLFLSWQATEQAAESRKRSLMDIARQLKTKMKAQRKSVKATLKDLVLLLQCAATGDYNLIFETKLYKEHGAEYCAYLEILADRRESFQ